MRDRIRDHTNNTTGTQRQAVRRCDRKNVITCTCWSVEKNRSSAAAATIAAASASGDCKRQAAATYRGTKNEHQCSSSYCTVRVTITRTLALHYKHTHLYCILASNATRTCMGLLLTGSRSSSPPRVSDATTSTVRDCSKSTRLMARHACPDTSSCAWIFINTCRMEAPRAVTSSAVRRGGRDEGEMLDGMSEARGRGSVPTHAHVKLASMLLPG